MRIALALTILLLLAPAAAQAAAPAATTGAATDVTQTSATLNGTVDPNGVAATVRFEYGTTTAYGQQTPDEVAGAGDEAAAATAPLTGLSANTTYHYRVVATNADGTTNGEDGTFKTAAGAARPGRDQHRGRADRPAVGGPAHEDRPQRRRDALPLRVRQHEPVRHAHARARGGDRRLGRRARPSRSAAWSRTSATTSASSRPTRPAPPTSRTRTFTTSREPTAITLSVAGKSTVWGDGVQVFGRVSGTGRSGIPVGLERQAFPYTDPFTTAGTPPAVRADRFGRFRIFVPALFGATHLRASTRTTVVVAEPRRDRAGAREGRRGGRARGAQEGAHPRQLGAGHAAGPRRAPAPQRPRRVDLHRRPAA